MTRRTISRIGTLLALCYVLAFVLYIFRAGVSDGGALLGGIVIALWIIAPVLCAAAFVNASPTRFGAAIFLLFELALISWTIWFTIDAYLYGNSTAAVGLLILPGIQLCTVLAAFLIALVCGWRMRPDFLKD